MRVDYADRVLRRMRYNRIYTVAAFIYVSLGVIIFLFAADMSRVFYLSYLVLRLIAAGLLVMGVAQGLLVYLRGGFSVGDLSLDASRTGGMEDSEALVGVRSLEREIATLRKQVTAPQEIDRAEVLQQLREEFAETLLATYESEQEAYRDEKMGLSAVRASIAGSSLRLRDELASLNRRGNLNLVIGILTTCVAAGLLAYMVLGRSEEFKDTTQLLAYYVPRTSTAVFIEVFGFFFLRLYKASLAELKYYQNELTSLAMVAVSIDLASHPTASGSFADLARVLAQCDRNRSASTGGVADETDQAAASALAMLGQLAAVAKNAPK